MWPRRPCAFWRGRPVAKNYSNGPYVIAQRDRANGPGSEGWPILAIPCHNLNGAKGLKDRSNLPNGENVLVILSRPCRKSKALNGLKTFKITITRFKGGICSWYREPAKVR